MQSPARTAITLGALTAALALAACALSACSSSSADKVVATVGESKITQATLNHWLATNVAGDYRELNSQDAPEGLVSDPPDYPRCVAAIKTIVTTSGGSTKLGDGQLALKCRQLHKAVQEQTLTFLISAVQSVEKAAEHGQGVSEVEVTRTLNRIRSETYPSPGQFKRYLAQQHRTLSDERYLLKRNILTERLLRSLKRQAGTGGPKAFVKLLLANNAKWTAKTVCMPGYRSIECRQYASGTGASPSAAVLVEHLRAGT